MWKRFLVVLGLGLTACGPGEDVIEKPALAHLEQKAMQTVGPMQSPRHQHCSAVLPDGKVLFVGGGNGSEDLSSTEIYDPVTRKTSARASAKNKRRISACVLLRDGSLMVVGSATSSYDIYAERYTPSTDTWTSVPKPPSSFGYGMAAIQLDDGQVMVTGGVSMQTSTNLFNLDTQTWTTTGSLNLGRMQPALVKLPDGRVLAMGGYGSSNSANQSVEVYTPSTGLWSLLAPMAHAAMSPSAVLLPSGKVFMVNTNSPRRESPGQIYDPASDTWTLLPNYGTGDFAYELKASVLDGQPIMVGRADQSGQQMIARFDIAQQQWITLGSLSVVRDAFTLNALQNGSLLIAGGIQWNARQSYATLDLFTPDAPPSDTAPLSYSASNTNSAQQNTVNRSFKLNAGDVLEVGTCNVPGSAATGDTYLRLFGAGAPVAANDDHCGGTASYIQYTVPTTGTYELRAGCYSSQGCSGTVTFRITPSPTAPLSYSASNTSSAQQNTVNRSFKLNAGDVLEVGTCNVPGSAATGDTYLRLFGAGAQVAVNDDSCGGVASYIQYTAATTDTYELRAGCYSGGNCSGTVTFRITPAKP